MKVPSIRKVAMALGLAWLCGCSSSNAAQHSATPSIGKTSVPSSVSSSSTPPAPEAVAGVEVGVSDISGMPNGLIGKEIQLFKVPADGAKFITFAGFHPSTAPISVQAMGLPPGGTLLACSGNSEGTPRGSCTDLISSKRVNVTVLHADGATHVAIAFRGTWPKRVVIPEIDVFYTAVDNDFQFGEEAVAR
jgi:hypothetical protein